MPINGYLGGVISATAPSVTTAGASGIFTLEEQLQASAQNNWPGYQISRSVRLRSSASAYFSRTLSTPTNSQKFTFSCWIKMGTVAISTNEVIFDGGSTDCYFGINTSNQLYCAQGATNYLFTTQVFRDPSSWYHLLFVVDTTQATASNRMNYYVNGVQITSFSTDNRSSITQNGNVGINTASAHAIGRQAPASSTYFDGYLAEINFIDGQALTPASFGATDAVTGVWNPIRYSGTYGNNGFYLNFSDNSSNTATTIGKDYSGNGNNWTPNNISVTAGTTYDSMVDVPIGYGSDTGVGGEVRGNYCTFNALNNNNTLSNANLRAVTGTNTNTTGTLALSSGKWYFEATITTAGGSYPFVGITPATEYYGGSTTSFVANSIACWAGNGGFANGDVCGFAFDLDGLTFTAYKNGVALGTSFYGNSSLGLNTITSGRSWVPAVSGVSSTIDVNFGQRAFTYTAPSGYKALCTQNLPAPSISNGANYMAATTYSGTGATQTVSNAVNSISFQPDFAWFKSRSTATNNVLHDVLRGTGGLYRLFSDLTNAESTTGDGFLSLASNGFTLDSTGSGGDVNTSGRTYVSWQWKGGGTGVSNTAGSITSTVSANTTAGFSVVTYTGNGTSGATIGHGLGATASFIILKRRDGGSGYSWYVQHPTLGPTKALFLDSTNGAATSANYWNNTAPTSTVFSVGNDTSLNASGGTYVAYCWSQITGYSVFITYTGNGSGDGPFVYCGFRPRYLMIKRYDASGDPWWVIDSSRSPYNQTTLTLRPNSSIAESDGGNANFDFLANGFKARTSGGGNGNESGATYIVAAFAENPFNISRAR